MGGALGKKNSPFFDNYGIRIEQNRIFFKNWGFYIRGSNLKEKLGCLALKEENECEAVKDIFTFQNEYTPRITNLHARTYMEIDHLVNRARARTLVCAQARVGLTK